MARTEASDIVVLLVVMCGIWWLSVSGITVSAAFPVSLLLQGSISIIFSVV